MNPFGRAYVSKGLVQQFSTGKNRPQKEVAPQKSTYGVHMVTSELKLISGLTHYGTFTYIYHKN